MTTFQCPECGHANNFGVASCESCLLVFEKHNKNLHAASHLVQAGFKLESLWQDVLGQYEDLSKHELFVKTAMQEKKLPFASQQYRQIIEVTPHDTIALKMRDKIIQMATVSFSMPARTKPAQQSRAFRNAFLFFMTAVLVFVIFSIFNSIR